MFLINKEEAELVRKTFPGTHVRKTAHKYYTEETWKVVKFIKNHRSEGVEKC